jgi:hypothetical protein
MDTCPPAKSRHAIAARARTIRIEQYGEQGAPLLAEDIGVPYRSWMNYEAGVTMPAEVLLVFIQITRTNPRWLLTGIGRKHLL